MFTRLAEFRLARPRRIAPGLRQAATHCNDNLPRFRRPAAARRRQLPRPRLVCHWLIRDGRLQCRWQVDAHGDVPLADSDGHPRRARGGLRTAWTVLRVRHARVPFKAIRGVLSSNCKWLAITVGTHGALS